MSRCIICGGPGNEILLMGRLPGDAEAPRVGPVTSFEPCSKCREKYLTDGILLVEMDSSDSWRPQNPTGRIAVLKIEAFQRIFNYPIPEKKIAMIEAKAANRIGLFDHSEINPEVAEG